jgi:hypothetical protein
LSRVEVGIMCGRGEVEGGERFAVEEEVQVVNGETDHSRQPEMRAENKQIAAHTTQVLQSRTGHRYLTGRRQYNNNTIFSLEL